MNLIRSAMAVLAVLLMAACGSTASSIEMRRTFDVLDLQPDLRDFIGSEPITGFRIGPEVDTPVLTEATWTAETRTLPAAGPETPPCNDGTPHRLVKAGERGLHDLLLGVEVIGDTGAEDISPDRNCQCDTHVSRLSLNDIRIEPRPSPGSSRGTSGIRLGREQLCPNRLDDLVVGDNEFDGPVTVDLTATLRVDAGRLLLDVVYFVREAR